MAEEDWKRRKEREQEEEAEKSGALNLYRSAKEKADLSPSKPLESLSDASATELVQKTHTLLEQVHHLYQMFLSGAEKLPPTERRATLEKQLQRLQNVRTTSAGLRFRIGGLTSQFQIYRERWDKMMKDLESGKIKRAGMGGSSGA